MMAGGEMDLSAYRFSDSERARTDDLMRMTPTGRTSVLDIGARDGHFSRLLLNYFSEVTALDLEKPSFDEPRITGVAGDVTALGFPDDSFDCVFCAEVLEHVLSVEQACREIQRVAKHEILIGVPYRQDIRVGRTTCQSCGRHNPPWGHVNAFDEERLRALFPGAEVAAVSFVGTCRQRTGALATALMDLGGNPWGTYAQGEPCVYCGKQIVPPPAFRPLWQRVCTGAAARLNQIHVAVTKPHGNWLHVLFKKINPPERA
jgi:SAM-dependent methyltransferase